MRTGELLRLVWLNLIQNKFKTIMTSIGIVVGAATIVMVIAIGRGSQMDVAEQFSNLNAGAIDISYEYEGEETSGSGGNPIMQFFGGMFGGGGSGSSSGGGMPSGGPGGSSDSGSGGMPSGGPEGSSDSGSGGMPSGDEMNRPDDMSGEAGDAMGEKAQDGSPAGESAGAEAESEAADATVEGSDGEDDITDDRLNQEQITLTDEDVENILEQVSGIDGATISYTTRSSVEGAELTEAETYTIAGVSSSYFDLSGLEAAAGELLDDSQDESKSRVCVLGAGTAKELFGKAEDAIGETLYIDDRSYEIVGVLGSTQLVSAGISPDDVIFIPYATGVKYITGSSTDPTITVIASDVSEVDSIEAAIESVLEEGYPTAEFTFDNASSQMEAAEASNRILTLLLSAMAGIVFLIGGIGIMNVFFVSVRERTNEIGILKSLGGTRKMILTEFLMEAAAVSLIGGSLGLILSLGITPLIQHYGMRVELSPQAFLIALTFAVLTGTVFGFYPALKASKMVPVEALNAD